MSFDPTFAAAQEAKVRYLDADFQVMRHGDFVRCAVTREAIRLDPKLDAAYAVLGGILSQQGRTNDARQAYQQGFPLAALDSPRKLAWPGYLLEQGEVEAAEGLLLELNREAPYLVTVPILLTRAALKKDVERLNAFMGILPEGLRAAFEFRNDSWFDEEVYAAIRDAGHALCLAEFDESDTPALVSTTDWGYLRLRRQDYSDEALRAWLSEIEEQPWKEAFVFFKHEDEGAAPRLAGRLLAL